MPMWARVMRKRENPVVGAPFRPSVLDHSQRVWSGPLILSSNLPSSVRMTAPPSYTTVAGKPFFLGGAGGGWAGASAGGASVCCARAVPLRSRREKATVGFLKSAVISMSSEESVRNVLKRRRLYRQAEENGKKLYGNSLSPR